MANPMGETGSEALEARFRPPSDAPVSRHCDRLRWRIAGLSRADTLRLTDTDADARTGKNGRHLLVDYCASRCSDAWPAMRT
jgi:hypothetical protein